MKNCRPQEDIGHVVHKVLFMFLSCRMHIIHSEERELFLNSLAALQGPQQAFPVCFNDQESSFVTVHIVTNYSRYLITKGAFLFSVLHSSKLKVQQRDVWDLACLVWKIHTLQRNSFELHKKLTYYTLFFYKKNFYKKMSLENPKSLRKC